MCHSSRHRRRHDAARSHHRPPADPGVRAADADREHTSGELRRHAADGRLSYEELDERLGRAAAAVTLGDLAALTSDLPRLGAAEERQASASAELREHVRSYLLVMALLVGIWAATGAEYFWPVWPMLGWGFAVASPAAAARAASRPRGGRARVV